MSLTLGEKLRQAREQNGMTISDVAEQTRISALYLENIENDDYRVLPGGIFNKGFVKSFAKAVGVDEQEALHDYAQLAANQNNQIVAEPQTYRPEVLTDDRASASNLPTIIIAVLILGLMTWGVLALVRYIQQNPAPATETANANANQNSSVNAAPTPAPTPAAVASLDELKIEFKAVRSAVSLNASVDGTRANALVAAEQTKIFEPKQSLRLSYSRAKAPNAQLTINGKPITLPTAPENPSRAVIEFEINRDNAPQIISGGQITAGSSGVAPRSPR